MADTPERRPEAPQSPESVVREVKETPEVSAPLEKMGVQAVPAQITTQVTDDATGQPLIQSPATQVVTIHIPASQEVLEDWSKGAPDSSLTWLGWFWLRMIKKSFNFGWRVVVGGKS